MNYNRIMSLAYHPTSMDQTHSPNLVFSVDVGGTRSKFGLVDLGNHSILAQVVHPTCTQGFEEYLVSCTAALDELCAAAGVRRSDVGGCGIGLPGYVDGVWVSALWSVLAFLEGSRLAPALEKALGMPVRVDNDARLVALGEAHFGGHPAVKRLLSLTLGSGLGFGLVVEGRLLETTSINHMAGHIPIRPGALCYCGTPGCLEMLVNASGLLYDYQATCAAMAVGAGSPSSAESVFAAAAKNDPAASQAVEQWLADLSAGLNAYCYLFGPDLIVLGGGLSKSLAPLLGKLLAGMFAAPYQGYRVSLALSQLQEQAGVLGAASLWIGA
jgi:glucokinase